MLLAAAKGVVGATVVTMGLITLPAMLRHGYDARSPPARSPPPRRWRRSFRPRPCWCCSATSSRTPIRPRNCRKGIFAPASVSVSDLFAGAIIPGFALVALYILYLMSMAVFCPKTSPAIPPDPGRAARAGARAPADRGADRAGAADPGGARLDPRRPRDADRSRLGRRGRRDPARRRGARGSPGARCRRCARPRRSPHDLRDPDRRDVVQPGVPRARRRRHGASRARQSAGRRRPARSSSSWSRCSCSAS